MSCDDAVFDSSGKTGVVWQLRKIRQRRSSVRRYADRGASARAQSRRTLHRAFQEVFGLGPVSFLRHKRLCTVHSILRDSAPGTTTVASVAMHQGFYELGRFSHYYFAMFGEHPPRTLGHPAAGSRRPSGSGLAFIWARSAKRRPALPASLLRLHFARTSQVRSLRI